MTPFGRVTMSRALRQWAECPADDPVGFDGISQLIGKELTAAGATDLELISGQRAAVAGWLQESAHWDLTVLQRRAPILVVTYTSLSRNSDQNRVNSRVDEVIGVAKDTQLAQEHGILPTSMCRAHVYVQELPPEHAPRAPERSRAARDTDARDSIRLEQATIMCERMRDSGLYDLVWVIGVWREPHAFAEPSPAVGWDRFASDLRSRLSF